MRAHTIPARGLAAALSLGLAACGPAGGSSDSDASTGDATVGTAGTTAGPGGACELEPDPGECEAAFPRWAYDPQTGECYAFTWGGCGGVVPFEDQVSCQAACESCEQFPEVDGPDPTTRTIRVRNTSSDVVYLRPYTPTADAVGYRAADVQILLPLDENPANATEVLNTAPNDCEGTFTCANYLATGCQLGCSDAGEPPSAIAIAPGGEYVATWGGMYMEQVELPTRCEPDDCDGPSPLICGRLVSFGDGLLVARAHLSPAITCSGECDCTPNADGWCQLPAPQEIDYDALVERSVLIYLGQVDVELEYSG